MPDPNVKPGSAINVGNQALVPFNPYKPGPVNRGQVTWATPVTPVGILQSVAGQTPNQIKATVAGFQSPIPIVYGRTRVSGQLVQLQKISGSAYLCVYLFAQGEIEEFEKIYIDGTEFDCSSLAPETPISVSSIVGGGEIVYYVGNDTQDVSGFVSTYLPSYADTLAGYVVVSFWRRFWEFPLDASPPRVEALVKGLRVDDPRQSPTTAYSNNPSLCLAHFLTTYYKPNKTVDEASLIECADYNDDALDTTYIRHTIGAVIGASTSDMAAIIAYLEEAAQCYVSEVGDTFFFVPNKQRNSVADILPQRIDRRSIQYDRLPDRDIPDDVRVSFYDPDNNATNQAEAKGNITGRISKVSMPFVGTYQEAKRRAIERLRMLGGTTDAPDQRTDTVLRIRVFGQGLRLLRGEVVEVTEPLIGITNKPFIITSISVSGWNWFNLVLREYQPSAFSDDVSDQTSVPDFNITTDDPFNPPQITGLSGTGNHIEVGNAAGDIVGTIDITWDDPDYFWAEAIEIRVWGTYVFDSPDDTLLFTQREPGDATSATVVIDPYIERYVSPGQPGQPNTESLFKLQARIVAQSGAFGEWTDLPKVVTADALVQYEDPLPPAPDFVKLEKISNGDSPETFGLRVTIVDSTPNYVVGWSITETGGSCPAGYCEYEGNFAGLGSMVEEQAKSVTETDYFGLGEYVAGTTYSIDVKPVNRTMDFGTTRGNSITF
jgi:hypothetical protein